MDSFPIEGPPDVCFSPLSNRQSLYLVCLHFSKLFRTLVDMLIYYSMCLDRLFHTFPPPQYQWVSVILLTLLS